MKWYEFIIQNWAQITVLIGVGGYILKVIYDHKYKKREIAFSYFVKERVSCVMNFLNEYGSIALYITQSFSIPDIRGKINDKKFTDNQIFTKIELFQKSYGQLLLFFAQSEVADCTQIVKNTHTLIDNYNEISWKLTKDSFMLEEFQNSHQEMLKLLNENNHLIEEFTTKVRMLYLK